MDILPVGSVIRIQEHDFLIIGYAIAYRSRITALYRIVPAEFGYQSKNQIGMIPITGKYELVSEGYQNNQFERFRDYYFKHVGADAANLPDAVAALNRLFSEMRKVDEWKN